MMNPDYWCGFNDGKRAGEKEAREKAAGGRIVSRMMKGTKVVKFDGEDYRTRGF